MSGPRVRAGLSEPPEMGRARKTAAPTHSPMATPAWAAPPGARSWTAVAMTTTIRMRVMTNSVKPAVHHAIPGPGWVEPRISGSRRCGKMTQFARPASSAPAIWAAMYPGTILQGNRPTAASPVVIAGLRWAPESPATA